MNPRRVEDLTHQLKTVTKQRELALERLKDEKEAKLKTSRLTRLYQKLNHEGLPQPDFAIEGLTEKQIHARILRNKKKGADIFNWINKTTLWLGKQKYGIAASLGIFLLLWPTLICIFFLEELSLLLHRTIMASTQTAWFTLIYFAHRQLPDGGFWGKDGKNASNLAIILCILAGFIWVFLGMPLGESYAQ